MLISEVCLVFSKKAAAWQHSLGGWLEGCRLTPYGDKPGDAAPSEGFTVDCFSKYSSWLYNDAQHRPKKED